VRDATCAQIDAASSAGDSGGLPLSKRATGSPSTRCARYARNRSESRSAHWQSSTDTSSGARSARLTTSQYRLWNASKPASAPTPCRPSGSKSRDAGAAAPANSSESAAPSIAGSSSWRTTPNANARSSSEPLASSVLTPARSAPARPSRQLGLADAGRALDQDQRSRPGGRNIESAPQGLELAFALQQRSSGIERH